MPKGEFWKSRYMPSSKSGNEMKKKTLITRNENSITQVHETDKHAYQHRKVQLIFDKSNSENRKHQQTKTSTNQAINNERNIPIHRLPMIWYLLKLISHYIQSNPICYGFLMCIDSVSATLTGLLTDCLIACLVGCVGEWKWTQAKCDWHTLNNSNWVMWFIKCLVGWLIDCVSERVSK